MITTLHKESLVEPGIAALPHVLLVLDQFPKTLGGGERVALRLASLLPKYGYRASILTFNVHPDTIALNSAPCPIYLLPLTKTYDLQSVRAAFELRRFIKEQRVQVVQTFFESSDIWAGLVTKALSAAKLIWSRRDMGILRTSKHNLAYRLMAKMPDAVFAVSDLVRQHCINVDRIEPGRVFTIYNGLDLSAWESPSAQYKHRNGPVITTAGNIRRVKGHDVFIKAAASVIKQFPKAYFSIAGDVLEPDYFAQLQALVDDLHIKDQFHFAGGVSNLRDHLASADVFVLPSRSEGFSNAIVEAMAASLPVVATDVGGNAEAVKEGVTGFIVPSENPDAIASAITKLLSNPNRASEMGLAGKALAAKEFTLEVMLNRTTKVYRDLLVS